jgi:hypothetical protein
MAITPKGAKKLSEKELKEMKEIEKQIDTQLAKKAGRGYGRSVPVFITPLDYSDLHSPSKRAVDEALRRYHKSWDVQYRKSDSKDPRETNYYEFTPKE